MNLRNIKKQIKYEISALKKEGWTLKPARAFIGELVLAVLAIAYLREHIQLLSDNGTVIFAAFFVGLVLYFKNKS